MIKGIDSQIMMQRATDYAKIAADQLSNLEHAKEFAQKLEQERVNRMTESVNDVEKALKKEVSRQKDEHKGTNRDKHPRDEDDEIAATFNEDEDDVDIYNSKNVMLPESKLKVMPSRDIGVELDIDA